MFWRSPKMMFFIGLIVGATVLGDDGGDVIKDVFSALRENGSRMLNTGGRGLDEFGDVLD